MTFLIVFAQIFFQYPHMCSNVHAALYESKLFMNDFALYFMYLKYVSLNKYISRIRNVSLNRKKRLF